MTKGEAINWIINLRAGIGKSEYRELWHYEQALAEIIDLLSAEPEKSLLEKPARDLVDKRTIDFILGRTQTHEKRTETHGCDNERTETQGDLISRKAAIDFIDAGHLCNPNELRWSDNDVVNFLKKRPPAEPEIIRCKDCKHWEREKLGKYWEREKLGDNKLRRGTCYSMELFNCINGNTYNIDDFQTGENFYCGFAERAE